MRDGDIYAAVSDKLQLKEFAAKDAEIDRLRSALTRSIQAGECLSRILHQIESRIELTQRQDRQWMEATASLTVAHDALRPYQQQPTKEG